MYLFPSLTVSWYIFSLLNSWSIHHSYPALKHEAGKILYLGFSNEETKTRLCFSDSVLPDISSLFVVLSPRLLINTGEVIL